MRKAAVILVVIGAGLTALVISVVRDDGGGAVLTDGPPTQELRALPYITWVPTGESEGKAGVTSYNPDRVFPGLNLYASRNLARAFLMEMDGKTVHSWSAKIDPTDTWQHVEMVDRRDLLAVVKDKRLIRLGWDSEVRWSADGRFHHDLAVDPSGMILALTRTDRVIRRDGRPCIILDDGITTLDARGRILDTVSLYDILKDRIDPGRFEEITKWTLSLTGIRTMLGSFAGSRFLVGNGIPPDLLHANSLEIVRQTVNGVCKRGDLLLSICELDLVVILDRRTKEIVWEWGPGYLSKQHHPTQLANGNILIFDNGVKQGRSRVIELDPRDKRIVWEYTGDPSETFFSLSRGAAQRLPNGNTLITESDSGHVFEVDLRGEIVWEFFNSQLKPKERQRAAIYRMLRIGQDDVSAPGAPLVDSKETASARIDSL